MKAIKKLLITFITLILAFAISINSQIAFANTDNYLYLGGFIAGFKINTKGVTVVGVTEIFTENGVVSPSKSAGIEVGDIILSMNGKQITSSGDVNLTLKNYKGGNIITEIERNGNIMLKDVYPAKDMTDNFRLGVFLRDGISGLGTVTYIDEKGNFASLGHPVTDENGKVCSVSGGEVFNCSVVGVNRAERGKTGELKGLFLGGENIGSISGNSAVGLFGKFTNFNSENYQKVEISNAKIGVAEIFCTVDGVTPKKYDIEILKSDLRNNVTKNLVIKITDKSLLKYTGGILQGMSGSPIIQNGKLVGAVTHVFVNDASRGYGISIQNMLAG